MLFLAGLLLGFRGMAVRRMRYFLLMCLGMFMVVQALGRTQLSDESPEVNSENLLVLLVPLVFCYGVSFFFTFLEQMKLPVPQLRYAVIAVFVALSCLPMIFTLLSPKVSPVVYPPYYPPDIQQTAGWMKENELMMSDVPWAVAWYGQRQCVWLTLNAQDDFFAINDNLKPVQALYLTPADDGRQIRLRLGALRRTQLGQFHRPGSRCKIKFRRASRSATRRPASCPNACSSRTGNVGKQRNKSTPMPAATGRRCPTTPAIPAALRRQSIRARLVATVQLRVNRPRKRLRVMRNHTHLRKIFAGGNVRVRDDVAIQKLRVES